MLSALVVTAVGADACQRPAAAADSPGLAFEELTATGLAEILPARRKLLEERTGKTPTGHAWWLWGLGAFDYDRDGDLDLIVLIHGAKDGVVIKNLTKETGQIRFQDATAELGVDGLLPSTDNYPLVFDFDGDGYLDIAGTIDDSPSPCLWNREGKRFEKANFSLHPLNYPLPPTDLNGDGYLDVHQVIRGDDVRQIYDPQARRFNRTTIPFEPPIKAPAEVSQFLSSLKDDPKNRFLKIHYNADHDLDGDGKPDTVVSGFASYGGSRFGRYLAAANDAWTDRTADWGLPNEGTPCFIQDLNGDGQPEMLIAADARGGLYLNDGKGKFSLRTGALTEFIKQACPYLQRVTSHDFDNDGDPDLAISNRRYGTEKIFENLGGGEFRTALTSRGWDADPLVVADLDDDGRLDLVIGGSGEKENIAVFMNRTAKVGNHATLDVRMEGPNGYAAGTMLEVYAPGTSDKPSAVPLWRTAARADALPVHVGLDEHKAFDLRATFPGQPPREWKSIAAAARLEVTPAGVESTKEPR